MPDLARRSHAHQRRSDEPTDKIARGGHGGLELGLDAGANGGSAGETNPASASDPLAKSNRRPDPDSEPSRDDAKDGYDTTAVTARSTLLQPRVAVLLGVAPGWHPLLFLCRLLSIAPAIWWGWPSALRALMQLHLLITGNGSCGGFGGGSEGSIAGSVGELLNIKSEGCGFESFEARLRLTESILASMWCGASAYLSFFFTDCLMSRWLVNYTPQATLVRLLTIDALSGYLTSWVLYLFGGYEHPRLVLPAWIAISTTLTIMYHVTQRKINIRKETSISISVFSIASFISMVALLVQLHSNRSEYFFDIPAVQIALQIWEKLEDKFPKMLEYGNIAKEL